MSFADPRGPVAIFSGWLNSWQRRYAFAPLAVIVATVARYGLGFALGLLPPFVLFFPTIILVVLLAGFGAGIFATLLSTMSVATFFWAPLNLFGTNRTRDIVGLGLFTCIGAFFSGLAELYRRHAGRLLEFERVVEGLDEMIAVVDHNYRYIMANRAYLSYRGMKSEDVIGRTVAEILGPEVFETAIKPRIDKCLRGELVQDELRYGYPGLGERDLFISLFSHQG